MNKSNSLFYTNVEYTEGVDNLFKGLERYAEKGTNPVYSTFV